MIERLFTVYKGTTRYYRPWYGTTRGMVMIIIPRGPNSPWRVNTSPELCSYRKGPTPILHQTKKRVLNGLVGCVRLRESMIPGSNPGRTFPVVRRIAGTLDTRPSDSGNRSTTRDCQPHTGQARCTHITHTHTYLHTALPAHPSPLAISGVSTDLRAVSIG